MVKRLSIVPNSRQLFVPDCLSPETKLTAPGIKIDQGRLLVDVVQRPWGRWEEIALNDICTVRILVCEAGQRLSDQRHQNRDEVFVVLDPGAGVELDGDTIHPDPGDYVFIPRNTWHRLFSRGPQSVRVLEVAFGTYDQANDIVRRHDDYHRPLSGPGIGAV